MAKLDRKDVKIFAENSKETLITEFRTEDSVGVTASFSRDPDVIQNENYSQGWVNDTNNLNTKIYGEDLNAVNYVLSYLLKYLYENGIAEWKSTTTYYQNSICKVDNALYLSLQNNNIGNDPTSTVSYWKLIPLENVSIEDAGSGFSIVKDVTDNVITFKTISVTGYGEITDNGDQLNINIAGGGGGGGGDTYWGTIRGTITNQTDLISLINLKQDIFTVDSPLVLTDEQHLTINKATSSVSGYLDFADWNTFNGKQNALSFSTPLSETSGTVSISKADTSTSGYLDYNDFNTFNGKQDTISATLPISITNNNIEIETADTSTTGVLSYTDWNTFNNKQNAINGLTITETSTTFDVVPKSSITTSNIGSSSYPFNNSYINNTISNTVTTDEIAPKTTVTPDPNNPATTNKSVIINDIKIKKETNQSSNVIDISSTLPNDSSNIVNLGFNRGFNKIYTDTLLASGGVRTDSILPLVGNTSINVTGSMLPSGTVNLGSTGSKYYEGWIQYIKTNQILAIAGGPSLNLSYNDISPSTEGYQAGYTQAFYSIHSSNFNQSSDVRDKRNIKSYEENILDKLDKLTPITYNYLDNQERTLGLSAQDLKEIEPLIVSSKVANTKDGESEERLEINLYGLIVLNMKAIKELKAKVETLEARVNELEGNKKELEK